MFALDLIQECLRTQNPYLDLGRCGLTDDLVAEGAAIDLALRQCTHLKTLILSNRWWEWDIDKETISQNKGERNDFSSPPPALATLVGLETLVCAGDDYTNKWTVSDMSFVKELRHLKQLNLSYNQISELTGLDKLVHLTQLYIWGNQISELKGLDKLVHLTQLYISYNQISELKGLDRLVHLTRLYISGNQISELKGLDMFVSLTQLGISGNRISELKGLDMLIHLTQLYISGNQISELKGLDKLVHLAQLDISRNLISELTGLDGLVNLSELSISNNQISELKGLDTLVNLKKLDISWNQISELKGLDKLVHLTQLDIHSNLISELKGLDTLVNLTQLDIWDNQISELTGLDMLVHLTQLNISRNQISELKGLDMLVHLKELDISNNRISELKGLDTLVHLTQLDISYNQISELKGLDALVHLTKLNISGNQISDIKGLDRLVNLTQLDISYNQISELKGLDKLVNLTQLDIWDNQISELKGLGTLVHLKKLNISWNQISELTGLDTFVHLTQLDIHSNQISELKGLDRLVNLTQLYIQDNQISELKGLDTLVHLTQLNLSGNRITDIRPLKKWILRQDNPLRAVRKEWNEVGEGEINVMYNPLMPSLVEAIAQGNEAVLAWWEEVEKHGLSPLNECKLIFVGDGAVGKTSLMNRLVYGTFNENEETTHGINKIAWKDLYNVRRENIRVNLWDFGGQHVQHSLHQFFFTREVVYVLVLSPRNDTNADYWLEQIEKLGCDSDVLVVYNWKEDKEKQAPYLGNFYELRKKYPRLPEPFLVSCKTGEGIDAFREALTTTILSQKELDNQYPKTWYDIKKELEETTAQKDFIAYEKYEEICETHQYNEDTRQRSLLKQLNKIGSIVFFDKQILNYYQVLNPDWVTTGAYAVLTSEITNKKYGHITHADLKEIFNTEIIVLGDKNQVRKIKYKENQFVFILELMLEFDLCQKNPFQSEEFLIPSAFKGTPTQSYEAYKTGGKHYRFEFPSAFQMLIMHKFMARNISKCVAEDYWSSGFLIKDTHSNTFALVETNLFEKRINFWITGNNIRGFWEVLRNDMKEVCKHYHHFKPEEQIYYEKDGKSAFLSYEEMLESLKEGVFDIPYHPVNKMRNINVLEVIDLFEDAAKTARQVEKEKRSGDTHYHSHVHLTDSDSNTIIQNANDSDIHTSQK